jgi:thermitase
LSGRVRRLLSRFGILAILGFVLLRQAVFASVFAQNDGAQVARRLPSFDAPYVKDEVIVKFGARASAKTIQQSLAAVSAQALDAPALAPLGVTILKVPSGKVRDVVIRLNQSPAVEFAEPNYLVQAADTLPNDPKWSSQYGPINIQAPQAWDITTGSSAVVIAVIDTGVDLGHPDLAAKIWANPGESGGGRESNGIDDDGDGFVDDWRGWDFVNNDNTPQDDNGHGTHVAGIAAAASNNGVGIAGVAWGARVLPLKVLNGGGGGSVSGVAAAMMWAADHGANVINLSLGGPTRSSAMEEAVNYAYFKGVTVVAAAGNNNALGVLYPAAYDNAIAIASTDAGNNRSTFSNYGPEVDLAAPGTSIYSTYWSNGSAYATLSGTSMATPHVAGVAALLAGRPGFDTPDKIRAAMQSTALDLGDAGWDQYFGFGLVQARDALLFDPAIATPSIPYAVVTSLTCPLGAAFDWLDASGGANTALSVDDGFVSVPLPFEFTFNGETKTSLLISTNGYLTFGSIGTAYNNTSIPIPANPNDLVAPFWDDLNPAAGGGIYYTTLGDAPDRRFVVEWNGVPRFSPGSPNYGEGALTFEVVLVEGSGDILFQYQTLSGPGASGGSATVGIEYATGASGVQYAYNTPDSLQESMAIKFSPSTAPACAPAAQWVYYFPFIVIGK